MKDQARILSRWLCITGWCSFQIILLLEVNFNKLTKWFSNGLHCVTSHVIYALFGVLEKVADIVQLRLCRSTENRSERVHL